MRIRVGGSVAPQQRSKVVQGDHDIKSSSTPVEGLLALP
ncbi:hypothetical protein SNOG_15041 [Parastagonospora nodorum SN15]|uniref:Uncharacterized protein n=1 Tax=Phaeosphaeria nodorum (strain SN15 / ATCC MYA-4574 / FGSC 10173) TaxID=321614 RepID=Q0TZN7_PHANO|nr:hypothetical protein SNOG_15041 [Parastagonospora nodorum SN15]EAT77584.1 hypothetical protein SNOG_15041 [Parastagonospora nodorum SN15]